MAQIRYNWGICTNRDMDGNGTPCPKCASKEKQRVINGHDFVCSECGERLQKVQPPKTMLQKLRPLIIVLIAVVVIGGIVAAVALTGGKKEKAPATDIDSFTTQVDTAGVVENTEEKGKKPETTTQQESRQEVKTEEVKTKTESKTSVSTSTTKPAKSGTKNLGYAIFKGSLKGGVPDDVNGRLIFKSSHVIDSRDPKGRVADPGDYVIGEFSEGHLVQGIWYGSDNVVKGSIIIGK